MPNVPEGLKRVVAPDITSPEDAWWIRDLAKSYPWVRQGRVCWVIDPQTDGSAIVLFRGGDEFQRLSGTDGVELIGRVIAADLGQAPSEKMTAEQLARLLVQWHREPRDYLLTPGFIEKLTRQKVLNTWLRGRETRPEALQALCALPLHTRNDADGSWTLKFHVINHRGGVERWVASGQWEPFTLASIETEALSENGTFSYPDEL